MKHISEIIEDILVEWAYRVHDGMPNPKNAQHIHELRESMEELNLPNKVIYEVIQNLINEEENPILKKTIKYKTDDGYSGNKYDMNEATRNDMIYPSLDPSVFEVKYPERDIIGRVVNY